MCATFLLLFGLFFFFGGGDGDLLDSLAEDTSLLEGLGGLRLFATFLVLERDWMEDFFRGGVGDLELGEERLDDELLLTDRPLLPFALDFECLNSFEYFRIAMT